jgi:hypothetical protein
MWIALDIYAKRDRMSALVEIGLATDAKTAGNGS